MSGQTLNSYEFWRDPNNFTIPRKVKFSASVPTYGGVAYFSWGTFTAGQEIILEWDQMTSTMFDQLQTILEFDTQVVWNPQTGTSYNVEVLQLEGRYVRNALLDAEYREDVKLSLLIRSEV